MGIVCLAVEGLVDGLPPLLEPCTLFVSEGRPRRKVGDSLAVSSFWNSLPYMNSLDHEHLARGGDAARVYEDLPIPEEFLEFGPSSLANISHGGAWVALEADISKPRVAKYLGQRCLEYFDAEGLFYPLHCHPLRRGVTMASNPLSDLDLLVDSQLGLGLCHGEES